MPFGGFSDFQACVTSQKKDGKSDESAKAICGKMQAAAEGGDKKIKGGTFLNYEGTTFQSDDIFLKYKLIDDTMGKSGFQLQHLDGLKDAIGKPFLKKAINPRMTRRGDGHLWSMIPTAGYDEHLDEAWKHAQGVVVDISNEQDRNTNPLRGGTEPNPNVNSKYVTFKITDPNRKSLYKINNGEFIPQKVSIGVFDNNYGLKGDVLSDYRVVHVQEVDGAAWPDATHVGTCAGTEEVCTKALRGASYSDQYLTSLVDSNQINSNNMSASTNSEPVDNTQTTATPSVGTVAGTVAPNVTPQPNVNVTPQPQVERLKLKFGPTPGAPIQPGQPQQQSTLSEDPAIQKITMQLEELKKKDEENVRRNEIRNVIPKDLFIIKGKLNEEAFNKEVEVALAKNWTIDEVKSIYDAKMEILRLTQKLNPQTAGGNALYGGSYSDDPELRGGSDAFTNQVATAFKGLSKMMGVHLK